MKNSEGEIAYQQTEAAGSIQYHTLENPRGSKVIQVTLADGTKVWLNSGSSLKYPVAFGDEERRVEVSGEAYFEVARKVNGEWSMVNGKASKGARVPFIVSSNGIETEVLGTHFNVNSYSDEDEIKVTLLEGSIRVRKASAVNKSDIQHPTSDILLKPGQQAVAKNSTVNDPHSPLIIHHSPNLEEVVAWKNGLFQFSNTELQSIMSAVSKWYNVEVVYLDPVQKEKFGGVVSRNKHVSSLLAVLEATGMVRFQIKEGKIYVSK
jgi:ferric-dicitrate binding protein FerR (iron transport regulator)